jgi:hypothetical protein
MSVENAQQRLLDIAKSLSNSEVLLDEDRIFLSEALIKISQGDDAKTALNVKAKRGEKTSKAHKDKLKTSESMKIFAMSWIRVATLPESEGGLGLSNEAAIGCIGELSFVDKDKKAFGLTEETLLTYWAKNPELRNVEFKLPD